jgi:hypothetical protein
LDAEKKALVYDNYSKLISATDTIRRMRANMDPLNPMASTLDPAIAHIYEQANRVKGELRDSMARENVQAAPDTKSNDLARKKVVQAVRRVLDTPRRLREMMDEGREDEARREWDQVLPVLEAWKAKRAGGTDVQDCIDDGEAALRGEPPNEKSWLTESSQS